MPSFLYIYIQNLVLELPAFVTETQASLVQGYWQLIICKIIHHKLFLTTAIAVLKQKQLSTFAFLTEKDTYRFISSVISLFLAILGGLVHFKQRKICSSVSVKRHRVINTCSLLSKAFNSK